MSTPACGVTRSRALPSPSSGPTTRASGLFGSTAALPTVHLLRSFDPLNFQPSRVLPLNGLTTLSPESAREVSRFGPNRASRLKQSTARNTRRNMAPPSADASKRVAESPEAAASRLDAHGTELELGYFAERVEVFKGEHVGCRLAEVERDED